jgi:hypothetical protein
MIVMVYHALGIDPPLRFRDTLKRQQRLVGHGNPILGLFG